MSGWVRRTGNSDVMVILDSPRGNESEESNSSVQTEVVVHEPKIETIAPVEKKKKEAKAITIIIEEVNSSSEGIENEEMLADEGEELSGEDEGMEPSAEELEQMRIENEEMMRE